MAKKTKADPALVQELKQHPELVQQVLAAVAASGVQVKPAKPFEKMDKAREALGLPAIQDKPAKKTKTPKGKLQQLAQAREEYFRKMGFGKYRKEGKKAAQKAPKAKSKRTQVTQLAAAREAYFRKMGYGKYRKAS